MELDNSIRQLISNKTLNKCNDGFYFYYLCKSIKTINSNEIFKFLYKVKTNYTIQLFKIMTQDNYQIVHIDNNFLMDDELYCYIISVNNYVNKNNSIENIQKKYITFFKVSNNSNDIMRSKNDIYLCKDNKNIYYSNVPAVYTNIGDSLLNSFEKGKVKMWTSEKRNARRSRLKTESKSKKNLADITANRKSLIENKYQSFLYIGIGICFLTLTYKFLVR